MENQKTGMNKNLMMALCACGVVILGVGSAWLISSKMVNKNSVTTNGTVVGTTATANGAGVLDPKIKYGNATGNLVDGGIGNEGTHHIEREGGPSHYVYLTSTSVDLNSYVGKKVEVWGLTLSSKKAGWLMDVAKIQVAQ